MDGSTILTQDMNFGDLVLLVISLFVLVAGILSIIFILWGGVLLILSGGKEDKIKPAINTIRYAILGIIITVITIFIFPILGRLLGLDVDKYAQPKRIFEKIEEIGVKIFGGGSGISNNTNLEAIDENDTLPSDFSEL
ncbi:hypothetical protein CSB07_02100 [Candidatus Gracilibacteria bacterium]|nr:MAG: hypothetical protein CSB07_02100 [Candidatus Gracilibacteria bacterium]